MSAPSREEVNAILERLDALEAEIQSLRQRVAAWTEEAEQPVEEHAADTARSASPPQTTDTAPSHEWHVSLDPQVWLARLGVLLIFLGMAFFFTYAVQQGWLIPVVRIILGLTTGFVLLALGWQRAPRHPHTAALLAGGGLALWYLSWFAAHALYDLVPFAVAFGAATLTTALTYALAWLRFHPSIAVLGIIGGMLTPMVLSSQGGSFFALNAYVLLVLAGGAGIYVRSGSFAVLLAMWTAGWGMYAWQVSTVGDFPRAVVNQRLLVQFSLTAFVLQLWWLPLWRLALTPTRRLAQLAAGAGATIAPLLWIAQTLILWDMSEETAGIVFLGVALTCALMAWGLRDDRSRPYTALAHGITAMFASLPGWALLFNDSPFLLSITITAYTVQAAILHIVAWQRRSTLVALGAHIMTGITALVVWIGFILFGTEIDAADPEVWASLLFIALLVGATRGRGNANMRIAYEIAAHLFTLGWLARETLLLDWGIGSISFLWALVGAVEYGLALANKNRRLYRYGLAVLVVVGIKLLLVDMQAVSLLWRAILFMVLGVLYVALGVLGQRHLGSADTMP